MQSRKIGVLLGGLSSEREVSPRTGEAVLVALRERGHDAIPIYVDRDVDVALRQENVDVAFIALHGRWGEDGCIQGLLEMLGIPYTGSDVLASALAMHKGKAKELFRLHNLPTPAYYALTAADLGDVMGVHGDFGFPCVVKPIREGSSVGVSRATDGDDLVRALGLAVRYDHKLLVERAVDAREIEFSVLGNGDEHTIVSGPGEIGLPPGAWYDYDNKYLKDVATLQIPAQLPDELVTRMQEICLRAFRLTGCKGLARVDFLVDRTTLEPYLNEINTMPGFTSISMYPKLLDHLGVGYTEVLTRLCDLALAHHAERQRLSVTR